MEEYYKYSNGELLKGRYAKVADLSEGSYGLVSVAKDTKVGTLVAVKYIYPLDYKKDQTRPSSSPAKMRHDLHKHENKHSDKNYTNDDDNHHHHQKQQHERQNTHEILKSLYEEAAKEISIHKILGSHQNVSALYDHFDSYLILQYCSRGDLYEAIQNGQGPATPKDIKDVFYQILDALEYCHSKGVYHRDLKPENILIDEDWSIKLCDWGLATTNLTITNKNEFDIGSERYMAPELFDNNLNSYDSSKIDIWSIGIILLTIVFHKNPFEIANYSDKRFVQFATNRESLFDIFSTMTGDLFSVLRYCLNIDPNNRDLVYVRNELEILNYFTIDDEDWVSGDDYYTDDELNYDHHEDKESLDIAIAIEDVDEHQGHQNIMGKTSQVDEHGVTNEEEGEDDDEDDEDDDENALEELELGEEANYSPDTAVDDDEGESTFYMDEDADKSNSTLNKEILEAPKEILLPTYNERAEALLSNSTTLKPIPINNNGGNNVRSKFFRNSRKPIGVASYNSYQKTAYGSNTYNNNNNFNNFNNFSNFNNNYSSSNYNNSQKKFNREDFFTPKSVFNHYMNKYSDKNERSVKPNNWKKNNKPRTWKRNYRNTRHKKKNNHNNYNGSSNNAGNGNPQSNSHHYHKKEFSNFNSPIQPRKKSDSFSSSKSKVRHHVVGSYQSTNSTFQNNNFQNSVSSNSNGKYVPPFMRSPNYVKSPNILPLNEAIDNLNLNDYEVFQLEDDDDFTLDTNKTQVNNINLNQTHQDDDKGHYKVFDKPKYMHDNDNETNSATNTNTNITNNTNDRPMSLNNDLASTSNGKYVPPFRRGSLSGHSQPVSITNNLNNYNNHNHGNHNNSYKRRSRHYMDTFNQLNDGASSVPGSSTDWFSYRKDWSVYD